MTDSVPRPVGKVNFSAGPVFAIDTTFFVDGRHTYETIYVNMPPFGLGIEDCD